MVSFTKKVYVFLLGEVFLQKIFRKRYAGRHVEEVYAVPVPTGSKRVLKNLGQTFGFALFLSRVFDASYLSSRALRLRRSLSAFLSHNLTNATD
jgi:hypothetical protein